MPLKRCQTDDQPGWKWGDEGKCYPYTPGNEESETAARKKALAQAAAMGEFPGTGDTEQRAQLAAASINDLPDSAFAYIEPGGTKDKQGKTVPRSKRHFPIHDAAHVRNALARAPQSPFGAKAMPKIRAAAKKFGIQMADERGTDQAASEVEHRSSTLQDVDKRLRLIDLIAVPWEQEADVPWRGEIWHEVFDRRAFDGIEDHAGRVPVNREHTKGDTVGKVVQFDPAHQEGLFARVKVAATVRGDETLALADEGMAFPSVGFRVKGFSDMRIDQRSKSRRILRAFLDHLSMVEDPAYVGAQVLAVRAGSSGLAVVENSPLPQTPTLDELSSDPVFAWAASRFDKRN